MSEPVIKPVILVSDKLSEAGLAWLKTQTDIELRVQTGLSPAQLLEAVKDIHGLIVRSETQVSADVLAAAPNLKAVGRAGVGVDNIDIPAATDRGVVVMNTPSGNTIATCELTFTHMLCATRPITQANSKVKAGGWARKTFGGSELKGKTLGIVGMGRIGTELATRARAFGMHVAAFDPFLTPARAEALHIKHVELPELFAAAHYITVHVPLTDKTRGLIDAKAIATMQPGVRLFNCARGGIICEQALADALRSGHVAAAGMDVFTEEPLPADHPLAADDLTGLVLTPHLGASTAEAQESVGVEIAQCVHGVLLGGAPKNSLNAPALDPATLEKLRPYMELGSALGTLAQQLAPTGTDSLHITYHGDLAQGDTLPLSRAIECGFVRASSGEAANLINAYARMQRLGIAVDSTKTSEPAAFTNLIIVKASNKASGEHVQLSGTCIGRMLEPHVVKLQGQKIDFIPRGHLLYLENEDTPGIVGAVGTLLGKAGVNIANFTLTRSNEGKEQGGETGTARSVISLDVAPGAEVIEQLLGIPGITKAKVLSI